MKKDTKKASEEVKEEVLNEEVKEEEKKEEAKETSEVDKLKKENADKEEKFLRLAAEYDNFRKRSAKEKSDIYSTSKTEVIKELLPIMDNFERAAENQDAPYEDYKKGIELIFNQFVAMMEKIGVESYGKEGDEFDPNIHSAVMTVEDENFGENQIAQVFSKGYRLGDKIIREAVVKVANT